MAKGAPFGPWRQEPVNRRACGALATWTGRCGQRLRCREGRRRLRKSGRGPDHDPLTVARPRRWTGGLCPTPPFRRMGHQRATRAQARENPMSTRIWIAALAMAGAAAGISTVASADPIASEHVGRRIAAAVGGPPGAAVGAVIGSIAGSQPYYYDRGYYPP